MFMISHNSHSFSNGNCIPLIYGRGFDLYLEMNGLICVKLEIGCNDLFKSSLEYMISGLLMSGMVGLKSSHDQYVHSLRLYALLHYLASRKETDTKKTL